MKIELLVPRNKNLYLAIQTTYSMSEFEIVCRSNKAVTMLNLNTELFETIKSSFSQTYELNLPFTGELRIFVVPCGGIQKLEISSEESLTNLMNPDVFVSRLTNGVIVGVVNNAKNQYFVTVYSENLLEQGSSYMIVSFLNGYGKYLEVVAGNDGKISFEVKNEAVFIS